MDTLWPDAPATSANGFGKRDDWSQLKRQASQKDIRLAGVQSELFKAQEELETLKKTFVDTTSRLRHEEEQNEKLEAALNKKSQELRSEQLNRENIESVLLATNTKLKSETLANKHLQMELENHSRRSNDDSSPQLITNLQNQVQALKVENARLISQAFVAPTNLAMPPTTPRRVGRPRSSSASDIRVNLEQELEQARSSLRAREATALAIEGTLSKAQRDLIKLENDKCALERKAKSDIEALKSKLEDREDELEYLRAELKNTQVLDTKDEEFSAARNRIMDLEQKLAAAGDIRVLEDQLQNTRNLLSKKDQEISVLRSQLDTAGQFSSEPPRAQLESIEMELERARDESRKAKAEIQLLQAEMTNMQAKRISSDVVAGGSDSQCELSTSAKCRILELEGMLATRSFQDDVVHAMEADKAILEEEVEAIKAKIREVQDREGHLRSEQKASSDELKRLQAHISQCETALLKSRNYATELHELYMQAVNSCNAAETRVAELEEKLRAQSTPATMANDGSINLAINSDPGGEKTAEEIGSKTSQLLEVAAIETDTANNISRLLIAIERLRSERDNIRRDLNFSQLESRMSIEYLESKVSTAAATLIAAKEQSDSLAQDLEIARKQISELGLANNELRVARSEVLRLKQVAAAALITVQQFHSQLSISEESLDINSVEQAQTESDLAEARVLLQQADSQLTEALNSLEEAEHDRLQLRYRISCLEEQVQTAQQDLRDAERRCDQMKNDHLSNLPESEVNDKMKKHIEELELRILRRTEQIGTHQHDIRRLETNLKMAEDTIAEFSLELEGVREERNCLLDDCARVREARDLSQRVVDGLEIEMEALTSQLEHKSTEITKLGENLNLISLAGQETQRAHEVELFGMVQILFQSIARTKIISASLQSHRANLIACHQAIDQQRQDTSMLVQARDTAVAKLDQANAEVLILAERLESKQGEYLEVLEECGSLRGQVEDMGRELTDAQIRGSSDTEKLQLELKAAQLHLEEAEKAAKAALSEEEQKYRQAEQEAQVKQHILQVEFASMQQQAQSLIAEKLSLQTQLCEYQQSHVDLETRYHEANNAIATLQEGLGSRLALAQQEIHRVREQAALDVKHQVEEYQGKLHAELEGSALKVSGLQEEVHSLHDKCQSLLSARAEDVAKHQQALDETLKRLAASEGYNKQLLGQLSDSRTGIEEQDGILQNLQQANQQLKQESARLMKAIKHAQDEKEDLGQMAQKWEQEAVTLRKRLEQYRTDVARLDNMAKVATVELAKQAENHKQELASLRQKAPASPDLEEAFAELKERFTEMEQELHAKYQEIEEYDDRILEALKEKKKLKIKVDLLTKKIQSLQTKQTEVEPTPREPLPKPAVPLLPVQKTKSPPVTKSPKAPPTFVARTAPQVSPRFTAASTATHVGTSNFKPLPSAPSTSTPPIVFSAKPRTPSGLPDPKPPSAVTPPSIIVTPPIPPSRKRRAPDDFDPPAPPPAQAIIAETDVMSRPRKALRDITRPSGFTPIRRALTTTAMPISDITNSPSQARPPAVPAKPKSTWLGKAREAHQRPVSKPGAPVNLMSQFTNLKPPYAR